MERDKKNYYQMTWRQIRAKINTFKNIPKQYAEYLVAKGVIVLDDPAPLKKLKQIVEKKTSTTPKNNRKRKKAKICIWTEENMLEDDTEENKLTDISDSKEDQANKSAWEEVDCSDESKTDGVKKLKLFPDDDEDGSKVELNIVKKKSRLSKG